MDVPINPFKQALAQRKCQYGLWLAMADAYCAEIAANTGFDWLLIDGEHAPNDLRTILSQLQTVAPYDVHPIVRPLEGTAADIKQLLDIGAQSLLIPMVETAEQASEMACAVRYPPRGNRGVGAAIARASQWNKQANYHHEAEQQICLLLQIESQKGLDNLDDILAVEGFDGVFLGPADLAASLGHTGESSHPDVQAHIHAALKKIDSAGKAAGILTTERQLAMEYEASGAVFIGVGVDVLLFTQALATEAGKYKKKN